MPTPNMSDEELDLLFQRGAEAYPTDGHLAGWERMEKQLDDAAKTQRLRRNMGRSPTAMPRAVSYSVYSVLVSLAS